MQSLRRAALRSALSATRATSTRTSSAVSGARIAAQWNLSRTAVIPTARLFSQTALRASENSETKDLEEAQRKDEENLDQQAAQDARQDVEESITQTEASIQEAMQEVTPNDAAEESSPIENTATPAPRHSAFVRNLVFEVTEDHLKKAFSKYGEVVDAYIARDPRGLSKGFGFVNFNSAQALQDACSQVNGSFWHGRRVTCIPRTGGNRPERRAPAVPSDPTASLYIGNIPYETTDAELNRLFRSVGNLIDVRVAVDRTTGWPRGFAHADFATVESAVEAKDRLDGASIGGRQLRLDFALPRRSSNNKLADENKFERSERHLNRGNEGEQ